MAYKQESGSHGGNKDPRPGTVPLRAAGEKEPVHIFFGFSSADGSHIRIPVPLGAKFDMLEMRQYFLEKVKEKIPQDRWWKTIIRCESRLQDNGLGYSVITVALGGDINRLHVRRYPDAKEFLEEVHGDISKLIKQS